MNNRMKTILRKGLLFTFVNAMTVATGMAALGPDGVTKAISTDYSAVPPLIGTDSEPLVMLVMSNDHELYKKAYTDYTDLDSDGTIDTTYNNDFEYYGYFNSLKCYDYTTGVVDAYIPSGDVDNTAVGSEDYKCTGSNNNKWSGNFLNWATMTRMDIVRKVLYGGKRTVDTASTTILERALIPRDIHAFVKVAVDSEIADGRVVDYTPYNNSVTEISICNVTDYVSGSSDQTRDLNTLTNPPLIKVASGQWAQWSSSEVIQCQFTEEGGRSPTSPSQSAALSNDNGSTGEYAVRVSVCVDGEDDDAEYCREYTDSGGTVSEKPAGLLQEYGEDGGIKFGLLTGSYNNNNEGGVLRKNITDFAGPTALSTDNEVNLETGVFNTLTNGIITTLDGMRIAGWDYGSNKYTDCDTFSIPISTFKSSGSSNRQCRDWGNPLSEIYLEALRYFAGAANVSSDYNTNDSTWLSGMNTASWSATNLITADNACANCSIIVLSTGLNMFDGDNFADAGDLPDITNASTVSKWTQAVGDAEGLTGTNVIVGNADNTSNSNICTTKTLTSGNGGLSGVQGLCPELPAMEGTYEVAGLAYYAQRTDLRQLISENQNIKTYTVALAESLPSFEIEASNGNTVSIVPSCQANTSGGAGLGSSGWTYCSLSDVKVQTLTSTYSHYLVAWEDSNWGNDYDMDGISSIEVCTATGSASAVRAACPKYSTSGSEPEWGSASAGEIQIRASVPQANAGNALRFGFIMNGSSGADGSYINVLRPGGFTIQRLNTSSGNNVIWDSMRKFTASSSTGAILNNPLWYAAKFGSFNDVDGDGTPNNTNGDDREWDLKDTAGNVVPGGDGLPDTFFPVSNPGNLPASLATIFDNISTGSTSSSAAAVVGNSADGTGGNLSGGL